MKTILFLTMCIPLSGTHSLPTNGRSRDVDPGDLDGFVFPEWSAINFSTSGVCTTGCPTTFDVRSPATATEPAIDASCAPLEGQTVWQQCDSHLDARSPEGSSADGTVWAVALYVAAGPAYNVSVQHRFASCSSTPRRSFNVTGGFMVDASEDALPINLTAFGTTVSEIW